MKTQQALMVFSILLVGLILYSLFNIFKSQNEPQPMIEGLISGDFNGENRASGVYAYTGTNYDNYNHYSGSSVPTVYYGKDGEIVKIIESNNFYSILVTDKSGKTETFTVDVKRYNLGRSKMYDNDGKIIIYKSPNKDTAIIRKKSDGDYKVIVTKNGKKTVYNYRNQITYDTEQINRGRDIERSDKKSPNYFPPGFFPNQSNRHSHFGNNGFSNMRNTNSSYMNSLPEGIPRSQIKPGQEDLYILKSEVVPPVCPACPIVCPKLTDSAKKCPPCPPCARCPEPSFECKKVPNYNAANNEYLPVPVVNDFSTFGM